MGSSDTLLERRTTEEFVAKAIVRTYSRDVAEKEPDNVIAQSLHQVMNKTEGTGSERSVKEWSSYYEPATYLGDDGQAVTVKIESTLLNAEWEKFIRKIDSDKTIKRSSWKGGSLVSDELTIESLKEFVLKATEEYESKPRFAGGKVQKYFHKICTKLDAHSALLDLLPNQNQYCSILCGSMKLLIKASLTHQKTAEILAKSLADMSDELDFVVKEAILYSTVQMKRLVCELYANVFQFLRLAMEWYQSKSHRKLLDSLASDRPEQFTAKLDHIKQLSNNIVRAGNLGSKAENRDIRILLEEEKKARLETLEEERKARAEIERKLENIEGRIEIGNSMQRLLVAQCLQDQGKIRAIARTKSLPLRFDNVPPEKHLTKVICSSSGSQISTSSQSLVNLSRLLQDHIFQSPDPSSLISENSLFAEHTIVEALKTWSTSPVSEILWIIGVRSKHYPAPTTSMAASVANTASVLYIPFVWVSHYAEIEERDSLTGKEDKILVSLLYTIIWQVIATLKPSGNASKLGVQHFDILDGTLKTWQQALEVLSEVLALAPRLLLIIIDGIERLDFAGCGEHYLVDLLSLLQRVSQSGKREDANRAVKLLFTTAGNCAALNGVMDEKTMVTARCHGRHAKKGAGKMRPGMSKLESFSAGIDD